ncbi:MAG: BatA and WFA domain-containing protein [candidate division Zixibacteria bacterium]
MGFLSSAYLFALAAVSIPLILHFLSRRRIKTIEFSSLRFLEQMQKSRMKWLKIKEILLLLLRMIILALIVMAFARPTVRGFVGSSKGSSSVAVILDRSASMEAQGETGSLFDEARRTAGRLIGSLGLADQVTIIPCPISPATGNSIDPSYPGDRLQSRLENIELGYGSDRIGDALISALDILSKSSDLNREIYIISDFQKNGWDNLPSEVMNREFWDGINLSCVPLSPAGPENIGITKMSLPPQMLVPGENFEIESELTNFGSGTLENVLVGVVVDSERKAQTAVSLPPGQPTRISFKFKLDNPGKHSGYIEIDYDRYSMDNKRYFTLDIPEKINLLAVGQTSASLRFLSLALDRPEAGQISYKGIGITDLLREDPGKFDIILIYDLKNLDPSREAALERFIDDGGGLFIALGKSTDVLYWNKFLKPSDISLGAKTGNIGEYIIWDNFDFEHPIFSVYSKGHSDRSKPEIPDIHIFDYMNLKGGKIIGSTSGGINLFAESKTKSVLVFGSGLDLASGDLPTHSFFLPLLVRSVEYLGSRDSGEDFDGIIGEPFAWKINGIKEELKLISPSDKATDINPALGDGGAMIRFTIDDIPGIYRLASDSSTISLIPFNVDPVESSDESISSDKIGELLGVTVNEIEPGADLVTSIKNARFGRELWKEFLIFALILLIIESILGRTSPPKTAEKAI